MMRNPTPATQTLRLRDRLSFRLFVLFLVVFFLAFFALFAFGISRSYIERRSAEANIVTSPQPVIVDPKLKDELSEVLAGTSTEQAPADLHDPFYDRTGLVTLSDAKRTTTAVSTASTNGETGTTATAGTLTKGGATGSAAAPEPQLSASESTKQRYSAWLGRAVIGDVPLDPRVFAIDDLLPVGIVDGGSGTQEVMFYSEGVGKTISFPVGTMFFDGWLTELRPEGVVFRTDGEHQSYKLRSWARSLKSSS